MSSLCLAPLLRFGITSSLKTEKAMAPYSSTLAWEIPWTEESSRLQSMGSLRVGHNWVTSLFTFMHQRRKWQPTPVFFPRESQGRGSLVGCHLRGSHRVGHDWRDLAAAAAASLKNGRSKRKPIIEGQTMQMAFLVCLQGQLAALPRTHVERFLQQVLCTKMADHQSLRSQASL